MPRVAWAWGWSGLRPDSQGAERAAILLEAGILVREPHALTGTQLPVAGDLDAGEVDETVARDFRRGNHTPALISVEPLDHASRTVLRRRMLLSHRPIVSPSLPGSSSSSDSFKPVSESTAHGAGHARPEDIAWLTRPVHLWRRRTGHQRHGETAVAEDPGDGKPEAGPGADNSDDGHNRLRPPRLRTILRPQPA
jgi:hypothetical protein